MHERASAIWRAFLLGAFLLGSGDLNDWSTILCGLFRAVQPFAKQLLNMATRISGMQHIIRT